MKTRIIITNASYNQRGFERRMARRKLFMYGLSSPRISFAISQEVKLKMWFWISYPVT